MTITDWLEPKHVAKTPSMALENFTNHHEAIVQCLACDDVFMAFYPTKADPNHLRCTCGGKDTKIVRYVRYHYLH